MRVPLSWIVFFVSLAQSASVVWGESIEQSDLDDVFLDNPQGSQYRQMASMGASPTNPTRSILSRSSFPENSPHICLALLSCCDRTDLLNHTLAGVIRHMEEDEPSFLRYEIAWVDNGSDAAKTTVIADSYPIDHSLRLRHNMGLAYGLNLLIFNLCTAPYILILEEDWLYLDELVAPQTEERKTVIARSVALVEKLSKDNVTAFDRRPVMGVFLRHESYDTFLKFPFQDNWDTAQAVDLPRELEASIRSVDDESCESDMKTFHPVDIDYQIFCGDSSLQNQVLWGSYTNGAGLYRRKALKSVGRMFGEPGDTFHDRYVESNFAYRAGLSFCQAAIRLSNDRTCDNIYDSQCTGAFHHIGGGRGTRPMNRKGTTCDHDAWNFYGTPMYAKFMKKVGKPLEICSKDELQQLRERQFRDSDAEKYRKKVEEMNVEVFQKEKEERQQLREQAAIVEKYLYSDPVALREAVPWMADMTHEEIAAAASRMRRLADSPHPLPGHWDSHGRLMNPTSAPKSYEAD
eukprot:Nitzschia sp. Nitz4//scaffold59_size112058//110258//111966//NITZ4_004131-RA/size112058-augustus-gene-0.97-mRNA-1//1//CDS//3329555189//9179//frame0